MDSKIYHGHLDNQFQAGNDRSKECCSREREGGGGGGGETPLIRRHARQQDGTFCILPWTGVRVQQTGKAPGDAGGAYLSEHHHRVENEVENSLRTVLNFPEKVLALELALRPLLTSQAFVLAVYAPDFVDGNREVFAADGLRPVEGSGEPEMVLRLQE